MASAGSAAMGAEGLPKVGEKNVSHGDVQISICLSVYIYIYSYSYIYLYIYIYIYYIDYR